MDLNYMSLKLIMSDINQIQNAVYIVNWMNLLHFTYFWKSYVLYNLTKVKKNSRNTYGKLRFFLGGVGLKNETANATYCKRFVGK